jgi:acetyl esterase/lipase
MLNPVPSYFIIHPSYFIPQSMHLPFVSRFPRSVTTTAFALLAATLFFPLHARAAEPGHSVHRDIVFAEVNGQKLALDLYLPAKQRPPLIVWVHGGGWGGGAKSEMPLGHLVPEGFAIASVEYRLSGVAPFPAPAYDIKAAIRFLRAKASELGINADRIAISGGSAGGHLAQLVGVTNGNRELEGSVGVTAGSSDVQAIVSFFGMSDFTTILQQSTPHGISVRVPALQALLGGQPSEKPDFARLASPVFHVNAKSPPLLLIHGDEDPQAPFEQSREMEAAYKKAGAPVQFEVIRGGVHGGEKFYDDKRIALVKDFLSKVFP